MSTKIKDLPGGSGNKIVYLIRVKEPGETGKIRAFISNNVTQGNFVLECIGYEIKPTRVEIIKTYEDAVDRVNKDGFSLSSMVFPWHVVISVQNVTYRTKA